MKKILLLLLLFLLLSSTSLKNNFFLTNNLEYPAPNSQMNMSYLNNYDIDEDKFIFIKENHFYTKNGRIKFFGINLTFNSLCPDYETAKKLAKNLKSLGINLVRVHHIDNKEIWGTNYPECKQFDPEKLDRFDFLINELKRNSIYVNLNLHVSWNYRKVNNVDYPFLISKNYNIRYGKGIDNFIDDLIELQKEYAYNLLNHTNKYTGLKYKDDPVIAMVEINNENSFYKNMLSNKVLDELQDSLKESLKKRWREYLRNKYKNFINLSSNWKTELNSDYYLIDEFYPFDKRWKVQITNAERGSIILENQKIIVENNNENITGFFQTFCKDLSFKKDQTYTVIVEIEGEKNSSFKINAMRSISPWENAGLDDKLILKNDGKNIIKLSFIANKELKEQGRITLSNFKDGKKWIVNSIKLFEGILTNDILDNINNFDEIDLPILHEFNLYPLSVKKDFIEFSKLQERKYWQTMIDFLKREVGVKVPITGTQLDYMFFDNYDLFDYIDVHNYWGHPVFPDKPWDRKNYYVKNISMVSEKHTTFNKILFCKIKNKPFVISEYNHPFPLDYSQEAITILSTISTLQDYDGIIFFNYLNKLEFNKLDFFSIFNSFIKKSLFPISSSLFRENKIHALNDSIEITLTKKEINEAATTLNKYTNPYLNEDKYYELIKPNIYKIETIISDDNNSYNDYSQILKKIVNENTVSQEVMWDNLNYPYYKNYFKLDNENACIYIGWLSNSKSINFKKTSIDILKSDFDYFQFTLFNKEGIIGKKGVYIITLSNRSSYSNIQYMDYDTKEELDLNQENYNKRIIALFKGDDNLEFTTGLNARLILNFDEVIDKNATKVYTIDSLGLPSKKVPFKIVNNQLLIDLSERYKSIVYIIEIK